MATRLGDLVRHLPARMRLEGTAKQSMETARHRLVITGVLFALAFAIVVLRLVDVTILKEGHEPRVARLPKSEFSSTWLLSSGIWLRCKKAICPPNCAKCLRGNRLPK